MGNYTPYKVKLKLLSPLHIGERKVGNLMQTRDYVPGRIIISAITTAIAKQISNDINRELIKNIGNKLRSIFAIEYFWPTTDNLNKKPWKIEQEKFDYLFKFGYASQAVDFSKNSTEQDTLHEVEYIGPYTREGEQVYLTGTIWVLKPHNKLKGGEDDVEFAITIKDYHKKLSLRKLLNTIQIGGERNYGWGEIKVENLEELTNSKNKDSNGRPWIKFDSGSILPAHVLADEQTKKIIEGPIEPFVSRVWKNFPGSEPKYSHIYFIPRSKLKQKAKFEIQFGGVLKLISIIQ